ncbi:MAG: hypothetical protein MJ192_08565 [Clostridia bacterium]|nr:hypothetical protein [Clostridia bacterium]
MCTSLISNRRKTIVGWNLDILNMEYRVSVSDRGVFIEINDPAEGWMPLFGANSRGDFVGMPACWPYDARSDPAGPDEGNMNHVIRLDIDLLTGKKTLAELRSIAEKEPVYSVPGLTFMSALSDRDGNVLHIIPGQGCLYYEKPVFRVLTNFSPFKMDSETHPWMGWDRYHTAEKMLAQASDDFDAADCLEILRAVSQEICPTVVSMAFDVTDMTVYWCENRQWDRVYKKVFSDPASV